jgi:hypothetical protein
VTCWLLAVAGAALLLVGTVVLFLLGMRIGAELEKHRPPPPRVDPDELRRTLARAYAHVPDPAGLTRVRCPDGEIRGKWRGEVATDLDGTPILWVPLVSYEALGRFVHEGPRPPAGGWANFRRSLPFGEQPEEWAWVEDYALEEVFDPNLSDVRGLAAPAYRAEGRLRTMRGVLDRGYLAVLRATTKATPRLLDRGTWVGARRRQLQRGRSFEAGAFRGAVVLMDLAAATPVCHAPLAVESSETLVYRATGPPFIGPKRTIESDFRDRFRQQLRAAQASISDRVRFE